MDFYSRYLRGEHAAVTAALDAAAQLTPDQQQEAKAVADVLMRRVRDNCTALVERLRAIGYDFSLYCDPTENGGPSDPLTPPDAALLADAAAVSARVGACPVTLDAFWRQVGGVALTGTHPDFPDMLDPLVVYPPAVVLEELRWIDASEADVSAELPLSPDDYHKDNVSGGEAYCVALPQRGFDFILLHARDPAPRFVPYLRRVILECGGFSALSDDPVVAKRLPLDRLTRDLLPF